jgi:hypothetical protein
VPGVRLAWSDAGLVCELSLESLPEWLPIFNEYRSAQRPRFICESSRIRLAFMMASSPVEGDWQSNPANEKCPPPEGPMDCSPPSCTADEFSPAEHLWTRFCCHKTRLSQISQEWISCRWRKSSSIFRKRCSIKELSTRPFNFTSNRSCKGLNIAGNTVATEPGNPSSPSAGFGLLHNPRSFNLLISTAERPKR